MNMRDNPTYYTYKGKDQLCYHCSTFHNCNRVFTNEYSNRVFTNWHSNRVFTNEHSAFPKMNETICSMQWNDAL